MALSIRPLTYEDGLASRRLGQEAFGVPSTQPPYPECWPPAGQHPVGAFDHDRLVARLIGIEFESWFGTAAIPTWGIGGVTVEAEYRGQGALTDLFTATFAEAAAHGAVISSLFPSAAGIYRRFGYELVGGFGAMEIPTLALTGVRAGTGVHTRRATADDYADICAVYRAWANQQNGTLHRTGPGFSDTAESFAEQFTGVTLALDDHDHVVGYTSWERGQGADSTATIEVTDLIALTGAATRALLRFLGSFSSVTGRVTVETGERDLGVLALPGLPWRPTTFHDYMLRVLDPVQAVGLRSYPSGLAGTWEITLAGDPITGPAGGYRIDVADGSARCSRTDTSAGVQLNPQGLALLYAGVQPVANLRMAGHATGGEPDQDANLDALFGGRQFHIRNYF